MMTMNESLMGLLEDDVIELDEAYNHSSDKQDMNSRVNEYLLERVRSRVMTPLDAMKQSYFKPGMLERLKKAGLGKAVQGVDLSQFNAAELINE